MFRHMRVPRRRVLLIVAALVAVGAGAAYATIPDSAGVIHACYGSNGALKVLDTAQGQCAKNETALAWNQRGPQGPPGPIGATGPQGPAGTVATLDALNGIPCRGVRGKYATVRVDYGTGLDAPVSITCVTHLVANPGAFSLAISAVTLDLSFFGQRQLPITGTLSGTLDVDGHVTTPGLPTTTVPFDATQDISGLAGLHADGSLTLSSSGLTGTLDPETGAASIAGSLQGQVRLHATQSLLGLQTTVYDGTCYFGTDVDPIAATFTTDAPGVPYSSTTGDVTLSAAIDAPSFSGCVPAMDTPYLALLSLFAGHGRVTIAGTTTPIFKPT
jgi:hypothetical protein